MAYHVKVTIRAKRDLADIFKESNAGHFDAALKWYRGLTEALFTLEEMPDRCPAIRENAELRHLLYGKKPHVYRVLYRVMEKQKRVEILHIRHCARQEFTLTDLE
jgi:toxin ParE1/3/4